MSTTTPDTGHARADGPRTEAPALAPRPSWWARTGPADLTRRGAVVVVWALMVVAFGIASPHVFLTSGTLQIILGSHGELIFLCMALVCVFSVGEFDFSVASVMGLSGTATSVMYVTHGWPMVAAAAFGLALGIAAGALNAVIIVILGVDPIIATLGMATALVGVALWLSNLTTVNGLPFGYSDIATTHLAGLPLFFYYGVVLVVVVTYVLFATPLGKHMTFVGANSEVARLAGVNVNRIRFGAFMFSGLLSGLGGLLLAANIGGYDPVSSTASLLPALAATFLGTAIIVPGRFNPVGTWIAVFFLYTGIVGLQLLGLSGWISDFFFGASLVLAVTVSTLLRRRVATR
ncbi:ABC transporter permease [Pseudofrankia asymbiotica]|uniref:ABC transporter permease n=1 Tax=Pseudofrankia asymbiotica TaxID=1834516 RepID=A0A1V2I829_9ACTN|nr:ABC transporter permease [Pseudofrankia asymbiotica]ONH28047.1 ABC transporter permease [Pseudofrankia asymbiotica]